MATSSRQPYEIHQLTSPEIFNECAEMMLQTNPWKDLSFTRQQCLDTLQHPSMTVHGVTNNQGQLLGFMATMAHGIGLEPMIEFLCIAEHARGKGFGSAFIHFFEQELFPDASNLYLFVSDINPDALRLYVRHGYQPVGAFPNFNLVSQTEFLCRKTRGPLQTAELLN